MFSSRFIENDEMANIGELARQYQQAEEELIYSGSYYKKRDFTVGLQSFMRLFNYGY